MQLFAQLRYPPHALPAPHAATTGASHVPPPSTPNESFTQVSHASPGIGSVGWSMQNDCSHGAWHAPLGPHSQPMIALMYVA
jgi:hypothetical protein